MNFPNDNSSKSERSMLMLALLLLLFLTGVAFVARPMTPIDETRYISVAWEMWLRGDFLVPFKNGAPYSHKPPLMIWLFQAGWAIFGVCEWWPRLVSPLVSALNLLLTIGLARRLWPDRHGVGGPAVLILASSLLWTFFSTAAMFDIILALFTLLGMHGTLMASEGKFRRGFALLGLAIGLGILTKGPVILVQVLPVALLAPWWRPGLRWLRWFTGIGVAILLGAAIALAWAIPAGFAGGEAYRHAIFWGQTADRMVESFAHKRPLWWYLPLLPVLLMPWLLWPGLWRAMTNFSRQGLDRGGRFCLAWTLPVFVAFSFISGKQPHYLIPLFSGFALLAARALNDEDRVKGFWLPSLAVFSVGGLLLATAVGMVRLPLEGVSGLPAMWPGVLLMLVALGAYFASRRFAKPVVLLALLGIAVSASIQLTAMRTLSAAYDVRPMALAIRQVQMADHPVAHDGFYNDQFHFAGRLQSPLHEVDSAEELKTWLTAHPDAYVVVYPKSLQRLQGIKATASQSYLDGAVALLDARSTLMFLDNASR